MLENEIPMGIRMKAREEETNRSSRSMATTLQLIKSSGPSPRMRHVHPLFREEHPGDRNGALVSEIVFCLFEIEISKCRYS